MNVSLAQCHDHPLVTDWTQQHYYGMKSFFARTYEVGDFFGEKDYGIVEYKTPAGEAHKARTMFLTGVFTDEPENQEPDDKAKKAEKELLEKLKKDKLPPPPPEFSRRTKLVEAALADDGHPYFARAIVNHVWLAPARPGSFPPPTRCTPATIPAIPNCSPGSPATCNPTATT